MSASRILLAALTLTAFAGFTAASQWIGRHPAQKVPGGLLVVLPPPVQVLLAGGDRHLAAGAAVARVLAYPADLIRPEDTPVRARIQVDAAELNPAHEDNYYLAAATLEDATLANSVFNVLERAHAARPYDMQPAYYLGVLHVLFLGDFDQGAQWAGVAAGRADTEANRMALERMSARWAMRAQDTQLGLRMLQTMYAQARTRSLKRYLDERMTSVRGLLEWRKAADAFAAKEGRRPVSLDEVRAGGFVVSEPLPAKGFAYSLNADGVPLLVRVKP